MGYAPDTPRWPLVRHPPSHRWGGWTGSSHMGVRGGRGSASTVSHVGVFDCRWGRLVALAVGAIGGRLGAAGGCPRWCTITGRLVAASSSRVGAVAGARAACREGDASLHHCAAGGGKRPVPDGSRRPSGASTAKTARLALRRQRSGRRCRDHLHAQHVHIRAVGPPLAARKDRFKGRAGRWGSARQDTPGRYDRTEYRRR